MVAESVSTGEDVARGSTEVALVANMPMSVSVSVLEVLVSGSTDELMTGKMDVLVAGTSVSEKAELVEGTSVMAGSVLVAGTSVSGSVLVAGTSVLGRVLVVAASVSTAELVARTGVSNVEVDKSGRTEDVGAAKSVVSEGITLDSGPAMITVVLLSVLEVAMGAAVVVELLLLSACDWRDDTALAIEDSCEATELSLAALAALSVVAAATGTVVLAEVVAVERIDDSCGEAEADASSVVAANVDVAAVAAGRTLDDVTSAKTTSLVVVL